MEEVTKNKIPAPAGNKLPVIQSVSSNLANCNQCYSTMLLHPGEHLRKHTSHRSAKTGKKILTTHEMRTTYLLTYSLTPWCRLLFEKLIVTQLVKNIPFSF
jgi:hypothetical protein